MKRAILWGGAAMAVLISGAATFFMYLRMTTAPRPVWDEEVAAYLAIVEEGQPSAAEAENGWPLVEELARRANIAEAAMRAKLDAVAAAEATGSFDRESHITSWALLWNDTPVPIQQALVDEIRRLDAEGLFELTARIADCERFVWEPTRDADFASAHSINSPSLVAIDSIQQLRADLALREGRCGLIGIIAAERLGLVRALASRRSIISGLVANSYHARVLQWLRSIALQSNGGCSPACDALDLLKNSSQPPAGARYLRGDIHFMRLNCLASSSPADCMGPPTAADRFFALFGFEPYLRSLHREEAELQEALRASQLTVRERADLTANLGDSTPSPLLALNLIDRVATVRAGTMLLLAVECYRMEHGAPPATLESLVPKYLDALPSDPYAPDGKFVYRLTDLTADAHQRGYLLYSVGFDRTDNGGRQGNFIEQAFNDGRPGIDAVFTEKKELP